MTIIALGFVEMDFADSMTNPEAKAQIASTMEKMAISPDAIAQAIVFAIEQPADVDVGEIVVRPTALGSLSFLSQGGQMAKMHSFAVTGPRRGAGTQGVADLVRRPCRCRCRKEAPQSRRCRSPRRAAQSAVAGAA